jgi:hypothetical protein
VTLDSRSLRRLSTGLAELYLPEGGDFPGRVISLVSSLVAAESCSYNHLVGPAAVAWQIEPAEVLDFPDAVQLFQQHLPEHPLLHYYEVTGDLAARRVSDVAATGSSARSASTATSTARPGSGISWSSALPPHTAA